MRIKVRVKHGEFDAALVEFEKKMRSRMAQVGEEAVAYAEENGEYHDVTGLLRSSNHCTVTDRKLRLYNTAPYADEVQARGLDVLNGAALFAQKEMNK